MTRAASKCTETVWDLWKRVEELTYLSTCTNKCLPSGPAASHLVLSTETNQTSLTPVAGHRQCAEGCAALGVCDNPPAHTAGCLSTHTYINKTAVREMAGKEASPKSSCPSYDNLQCGGRWKIQCDFTPQRSLLLPQRRRRGGITGETWCNMGTVNTPLAQGAIKIGLFSAQGMVGVLHFSSSIGAQWGQRPELV